MSDKLGDVNGVLWWLGWRPGISIVLGLVAGIPLAFAGESGPLIVLGLVAGVVGWFLGTREINGNAGALMRKYGEYTEQAAQRFTSTETDDTTTHTLTYSRGSSFLVEPAEQYFSTTLVVRESSVMIHEGVGLNMPDRKPWLDDDTTEVYYDQIASVTYNRPNLEIKTSDGGELEYQSSREPDDALNELQTRLRAYKKAV